MPDPAPIQLAYVSPADSAPVPNRDLLTAATVCGVVPLCVGILVLLGFLITRQRDFAALGVLTILGGLLLFAAGAICLVIHSWQAARLPKPQREPHSRAATTRFVLLLCNFPAAIFCIYVADLAGL